MKQEKWQERGKKRVFLIGINLFRRGYFLRVKRFFCTFLIQLKDIQTEKTVFLPQTILNKQYSWFLKKN